MPLQAEVRSHPRPKYKRIVTSNNHRLESAGLNALEELLRCWGCTVKIVNHDVYFEIGCF